MKINYQSKSGTELGRMFETPERKPRKLNRTKEKLAHEQEHPHEKPVTPWISTSKKSNKHGKTRQQLSMHAEISKSNDSSQTNQS